MNINIDNIYNKHLQQASNKVIMQLTFKPRTIQIKRKDQCRSCNDCNYQKSQLNMNKSKKPNKRLEDQYQIDTNIPQLDDLDEYLIRRQIKNRNKIKSLKKQSVRYYRQITQLKDRLGRCQKFIGKMNIQNKTLKKSLEKMKSSTTRVSRQSGSRKQELLTYSDNNINSQILRDSDCILRYLPSQKKIKDERFKTQPEQYLNYNQQISNDYQLLTPRQHNTTQDLNTLTYQLNMLVIKEKNCHSNAQRRQLMEKIFKISQKINQIKTQ